MWFNKSVAIINAMLKILYITSLRYIYIYIYKFRFRMDALNPNMSLLCMLVHKNRLKWTKMD